MLASSDKRFHLPDGSLHDSAAFNLFHSKFTWGGNSHTYWPLALTQLKGENCFLFLHCRVIPLCSFLKMFERARLSTSVMGFGLIHSIPTTKGPFLSQTEHRICLVLLTPEEGALYWCMGMWGVLVRKVCHCTKFKEHKNTFNKMKQPYMQPPPELL